MTFQINEFFKHISLFRGNIHKLQSKLMNFIVKHKILHENLMLVGLD